MNLKPIEKDFWQRCVAFLGDDQCLRHAFVTASHAGNREITDHLLSLYLCGKKSAGCSIEEAYLSANQRLPQVGDFWILLNSQNQPGCVLQTKKIERHKFRDVPIQVAIAEGEGDLSLEYWKRVHGDLYQPYLRSWGIKDVNDATVITEFFELVYK